MITKKYVMHNVFPIWSCRLLLGPPDGWVLKVGKKIKMGGRHGLENMHLARTRP
jgi:hypothetical protein